jgi:predicted methyltransferase
MNKMLAALVVPALALPAAYVVAQKASPAIAAAVASPSRTPANVARDRYRHPAETLAFFGVRPDQTVVEFLPSGGWYTEILAPLLSGKGRYVGLTGTSQKAQDGLAGVLAKGGDRYKGATAATLDAAAGTSSVPDGSADVVLTFRNVHNLIMAGGQTAPNSFKAFYRMLKPGGTLGVVDHRLPEGADTAAEMKSGYLKRSTVVRLAEQAGFRLAGESQVNANAKDTHDWPEGVWTLPPVLRRGDVDRAKYLAVGESDRMTLKFVKPAR